MSDNVKKPTPINPFLNELATIENKAKELEEQADRVISEIREGLHELVVVFIDMVGSTQFKRDNSTTPEKWIHRVRNFSIIVASYIEKFQGTVVKYIGDEVMGVFHRPDDAWQLVQCMDQLEKHLTSATRVPTQVKMTIDMGPVYLLKFDGHDALDPQGTPIDRCARIAKHAKEGLVLSSREFVKVSPDSSGWISLGSVPMKGLGETEILYWGPPGYKLPRMVELEEEAFNRQKAALELLQRFTPNMGVILWENEFDQAWNMIHTRDYVAERNVVVILDQFFQKYYDVVAAHLLTGTTGDALAAKCEGAVRESMALARSAWEQVVDAFARLASSNQPNNVEKYVAASMKQWEGKSNPSAEAAIAAYREAVKLFKDLV